MDLLNYTKPADGGNSPDGVFSPTQFSIIVSLLTLIGLLMLVSYLWIIVTVVRTRKLHTVSNCFLASLAMSEISIGVLGLPSLLIFTSVRNFSFVLVFFLSLTFTFCLLGYFLNLVLVAADKWFKISRPFMYTRTMTRMRCTVCLAVLWGSSVVVSILGAVIQTYSINMLQNAFESFSLMMVIYCFGIILPCTVTVTVVNIAIVRIARRQARAIAGDVPTAPRQIHQGMVEDVTEGQPLPAPPNHANHLGPDHRKSTRQFSIFFLLLVLAWAPGVIFAPIMYFTKAAMGNINLVAVYLVLSAVTLVQTAFGTLILTLLQPEYKQALRRNFKSMGKKLCCNRQG